MTIRTLIVDDEEPARSRLRELLEREADVGIVGESDGGRPAVEAIRSLHPDLVFLDVQMPEMDGFAVLRELRDEEIPVVVFATAYEEHAIRAFEVRALDYLLKPFREERLQETLDRVRAALVRPANGELVRSVRELLDALEGERPRERLAIRTPGRIRFVALAEIDWFEAAGNYILVHSGDRTHLVRETMTELQRRLDSRRFVRVHRSSIVNLERVQEVRVSGSGDGRVVLTNRRELPLSRRYRKGLEDALGS
jgi:two-component system, LytTR family, response regulator